MTEDKDRPTQIKISVNVFDAIVTYSCICEREYTGKWVGSMSKGAKVIFEHPCEKCGKSLRVEVDNHHINYEIDKQPRYK